MTTISVYDDTAKRLEASSELMDVPVAEIIDALVSDYLEELEGEAIG